MHPHHSCILHVLHICICFTTHFNKNTLERELRKIAHMIICYLYGLYVRSCGPEYEIDVPLLNIHTIFIYLSFEKKRNSLTSVAFTFLWIWALALKHANMHTCLQMKQHQLHSWAPVCDTIKTPLTSELLCPAVHQSCCYKTDSVIAVFSLLTQL